MALFLLLTATMQTAAVQQQPSDAIVVTLRKAPGAAAVGVPARCSDPPSTDPDGTPGHPGDALRARLGLKVPKASALVIIHRFAAHHTSTQWSVVAWRDASARWTVQRGGENGGGLLKRERVVLPVETWRLPLEAGALLDRLLGDAGTFREPALGEQSYPGSLDSTMEIIGPAGRGRWCWSGQLTGTLGALAIQVMDPS